MKYIELVALGNLVSNIPLTFNNKKLSSDTAANIVMLKVKIEKKIKEMKEAMIEIAKNLKKEGYDERNLLFKEKEKIDAKIKEFNKNKKDNKASENKSDEYSILSEKELRILKEYNKIESSFIKEKQELLEIYNIAYNKQLLEEVLFDGGISKEDWKELYDMIGVEGKIKFKYSNGSSRDIDTVEFIKYLGDLIN